MKSVLVTGASGFIGRQTLKPLIERGYRVHAVARRPAHGEAAGSVTWHACDLLAPGAAEALIATARPSHLLHLAWNTAPGQYWTAADNLDWVAASLRLYRAFSNAGGVRVVVGGTCAEYCWEAPELDEISTPLRPRTLYGTAKNSLRQLIEAQAGAGNGPSWAWGRTFFLFGPHEDHRRLVSGVMTSLLAGQPALCSHGRQQRDFMHVADVAAAFVALLDSPVVGPVNIASGRCRMVAEVVTMIAEMVGRPDLIRLGARPAPADEPLRLAAATHRLFQEVGFKPVFDLPAALAETLSWWRGSDLSAPSNPAGAAQP